MSSQDHREMKLLFQWSSGLNSFCLLHFLHSFYSISISTKEVECFELLLWLKDIENNETVNTGQNKILKWNLNFDLRLTQYAVTCWSSKLTPPIWALHILMTVGQFWTILVADPLTLHCKDGMVLKPSKLARSYAQACHPSTCTPLCYCGTIFGYPLFSIPCQLSMPVCGSDLSLQFEYHTIHCRTIFEWV